MWVSLRSSLPLPAGALDTARLGQLADAAGVLLLAPKSIGSTWDMFGAGGVGDDAACLDAALKQVFGQVGSCQPGILDEERCDAGPNFELSSPHSTQRQRLCCADLVNRRITSTTAAHASLRSCA